MNALLRGRYRDSGDVVVVAVKIIPSYLAYSDLPSTDPCACNLPFVALELVARYWRGTIYCGHEGGIP